MKTVYVMNRDLRDYSEAKKFGELSFLTEGKVTKSEPQLIYNDVFEILRSSKEDDILLLNSINIIACIASLIFHAKHQKVNYLIYERGEYHLRTFSVNL